MERITSKLKRVLVITLLGAAMLATVGSVTLKASSFVTPQTGTPIPPRQFEFQGKTLGRVPITSVPDNRSICDKARDARARNSPAAPNLEAQCRAQMPAKTLGRVPVTSTPSTSSSTPSTSAGAVCDRVPDARARNSPALPNLVAQCGNHLAAIGEAIENQYPWAAERRSQQRVDAARRGFDIGMAAAEGQTTAPDPNRHGIYDSLNGAEQEGYNVAVDCSLKWNISMEQIKNELAVKGAGLATADQWAAGVRNQQPDGPARRGFDIGLAAAAEVDTSGTGKQAIRALLRPDEQAGFDMALLYSEERNKNARGADMPSADPLASRGTDVSREDPSAAEPRPLPRRPVRRGDDSRSLRATLEHLRQGKEFLEIAAPDQDGHLDKAIDDINDAIQELEKALRQRQN